MKTGTRISLIAFLFALSGCVEKEDITTIYLIGDSTMADYSDNYDQGKDYMKTRYPMTGWGQVFQTLFNGTNLDDFDLIQSDSVRIDDRARGGRSTRTFFQEGRWRSVHTTLKKGDLVLIQFGHNDASEKKTERYVNIEGYQEFLRLYVSQAKEKEAIPIILTPVCRNYPWKDGFLENVHGDYPEAAKAIAIEMDVLLIDLNQLSMKAFSAKGKEYATKNYFMNIPPGKYEGYPDGLNDNTHFQPEGARAVAGLIFDALQKIKK